MSKGKKTIALLLCLLLLLAAAFLLSGYLYYTLMKKEPVGLDIGLFLQSLFSDALHLRLFLALLLISFVACVTLFSRGFTNEYKSDMQNITDSITTPVRAGQAQHGSARFLTQKEIRKAFPMTVLPARIREKNGLRLPKGGITIGYEKNKKTGAETVFFVEDDIHSLILGATRSGKTRGFILQSISLTALSGESMILSDPKGELLDYTSPYLKELGYEVVAIDFRMPKKSKRYNFLQPVVDAMKAGDMPKAIDCTWDIATTIVPETYEKIWQNGEKSVIAGAILAVVYDNRNKPQHQNLSTVYSFINRMSGVDRNGILFLKKYVDRLPYEHPAKEVFGVAINAPDKQRASFITGALSTLNLFTNPHIRDMTAQSDFSLRDTGGRKRAVFIVLPDDKNTFNSLASLLIEQQYTALVEFADAMGGRLPNRCNFILDEFGNFTKIPNFLNFLTVGGGRGIRFNIVIQSFAQLAEKYGDKITEGIKDNCQCLIYLASSNPKTVQEISQRLGKYTVASFGRSSGRTGHSTSFSSNQSQSLTGRELLTADEVSLIMRPFVLVLYQGKHPAIMQIPDISKWRFNQWLGMGDMEHNRQLRMVRQMQRRERVEGKAVPCDTWDTLYTEQKPYMPDIEMMYMNDEIGDGFREMD